jgi:hypothetical protein
MNVKEMSPIQAEEHLGGGHLRLSSGRVVSDHTARRERNVTEILEAMTRPDVNGTPGRGRTVADGSV